MILRENEKNYHAWQHLTYLAKLSQKVGTHRHKLPTRSERTERVQRDIKIILTSLRRIVFLIILQNKDKPLILHR